MTARTPAQFRNWSIAHKAMANTVCVAMAFAQVERERVDAYVLPIFQTFRFVDEHGVQIASPSDLYLCNDNEKCKAFFDQCDAAHREHGWIDPEGRCPAGTAERLLFIAEEALLQDGCGFFDVEPWQLNFHKRQEMLNLLLKACLNV